MTIHQSVVFKGRCFEVFERKDGILQINIHDNTYFEVADVKELIKAAGEIGNGKKFLNLIYTGKGTLLEDRARLLSSSDEGCIYKLADAFVINTLAQQLIASFMIKVNKPPVPTAFFKDDEAAINWLKGLHLTDQ